MTADLALGGPDEVLAMTVRRDRLVLAACLTLSVLQALPFVLLGYLTDGGRAALDGALSALASPDLLGVVAFGLVLGTALTRPGLRPVPGRGAVPRAEPAVGPGPLPRGSGLLLRRLCWAAGAAAALTTAFAAAAALSAVTYSGGAFGSSGPVSPVSPVSPAYPVSEFLSLVAHVVTTDPRAVTALVVALVVLIRAGRPTGPVRTPRPDPRRSGAPAARTTRWSLWRPSR